MRHLSTSLSGRGLVSYVHPGTGRRYLAGWATESGFGSYSGQKLVAVSQQEEAEALASVTALLRQFVVLGLVTAVVIVGMAAWISGRFSRPLVEMASVAERISQGEVHQEIAARSNDEIGAMADAFRAMTGYLKEMATHRPPHRRRAVHGFPGAAVGARRHGPGLRADARLSHARWPPWPARIAEGDLRDEVRPRGEGDALGHSIQRMATNLKDMITRLRYASDQVAATSSAIAGSAEESARSAETAAAAVEEMTSTMHEMGANIQNVGRNVSAQAASVTADLRIHPADGALHPAHRRDQQEPQRDGPALERGGAPTGAGP